MDKNRRSLLACVAVAGAAAVTRAKATGPEPVAGGEIPWGDGLGMLYDTTKCIGCKACVVACREANDLTPVTTEASGHLYDEPIDLTADTMNIIKLYKEDPYRSYMKRQCMHCVDPACVGACMIGAFKKREHGVITWDGSRCIGCRYCQVACPYQIPTFQWFNAAPKIVKCEMCKHRTDKPFVQACCEVCPREAVISGTRAELLAEAKRRIAESPGKYHEDRVFGETEGGGTQVLYLSHVPFDKIGLPALDAEPVGKLARDVQHGIYKGFIAPAVLYAGLGVVMLRNRKKNKGAGTGAGHE